MLIYTVGLFNNEVELTVPPKKPNNKSIKVKSLNGYDSIREVDDNNTMAVKQPVVNEKLN